MSFGREVSRDEAMLLIGGWRESNAAIWAQCEIVPVAFSFRGRIVGIEDGKCVRFLALDGKCEFVFDFKDDFLCIYADPRDYPEEAKVTVCALSLFFPPRPGYAEPHDKDVIVLSELIEGAQ
jgi:hypothetical protein